MRLFSALITGRWRVAAIGLLCSGSALLATSPAQASFSLPACGGSSVQGEGSSFQASSNNYWKGVFASITCPTNTPSVSYLANGSGAGRAAVGASATGVRGGTGGLSRFAASDDPIQPALLANANAGPPPSGSPVGTPGPSAGHLHEIPVAAGAASMIAHFPEGCWSGNQAALTASKVTTGQAGDGTGDSPTGTNTGTTQGNTIRLRLPDSTLAKVWEGTLTMWQAAITDATTFLGTANVPLAGNDTGVPSGDQQNNGTACSSVKIIRIVRFDDSGTTFTFKNFLGLVDPTFNYGGSGGWTSGQFISTPNNTWPVNGGSTPVTPTAVPSANNICVSAQSICRGQANGGLFLAQAVAATDGSIGYVDLATARGNGFQESQITGSNNSRFWMPVQPVTVSATGAVTQPTASTAFVEPTTDATAHVSNNNGQVGGNGAACTNAAFRGLPPGTGQPSNDPTFGDWTGSIATGSTTGVTSGNWPICILTYDLAFDDNAPVYGNTPTEQGYARTVKDYLSAIVSSTGAALIGTDYSPLPTNIEALGQAAVSSIDWNKAAGGGGGGGGGGGTTTTTTTGTTTTTTTTATISNAFTIVSALVKSNGDIVLTVQLPGPGQLGVNATSKFVTITKVKQGKKTKTKRRNHTITVATANSSVGGGAGVITLHPGGTALATAKTLGRLSVSVAVSYTPAGGTVNTQTTSVTLKGKKTTKKKTKKKK